GFDDGDPAASLWSALRGRGEHDVAPQYLLRVARERLHAQLVPARLPRARGRLGASGRAPGLRSLVGPGVDEDVGAQYLLRLAQRWIYAQLSAARVPGP